MSNPQTCTLNASDPGVEIREFVIGSDFIPLELVPAWDVRTVPMSEHRRVLEEGLVKHRKLWQALADK